MYEVAGLLPGALQVSHDGISCISVVVTVSMFPSLNKSDQQRVMMSGVGVWCGGLVPEGVYSEGLVPPFPTARDLPFWRRNHSRDFLSNCFCRLHGRGHYVLGV